MLGFGSDEKEKAPREISKIDSSPGTKKQPEVTLLKEAQQDYERELYSVARESFLKLSQDYPTGPYAEYATIKAADCLFEQKDFRGSAKAYEDIVYANATIKISATGKAILPSEHADYLLYRAALSHKLLNPGAARDTSRLERAEELFKRVLVEHPKSPYASLARLYLKDVNVAMAKNDKAVLTYYEKTKKESALEARDTEFKNKYGVDARTFDAEDTEPPVDAKVEDTDKELEKVSHAQNNRLPVYISALTCDPNTGTAILELGGVSDDFDESQVTHSQDIDGIEILSPLAKKAPKQSERSDCLSKKDLLITSKGEFKFFGADSLSINADRRPVNIIISVNTN